MLDSMQHPVVYLILKRMRAPLILLILAYTISMVGLTLIPGVDENGNEWHFTIFEAFYFVSYMATTIGFGETPFDFTHTQRLWVSFSIYLTVISWLTAIGKIIGLLQDPALKSVWTKQRFIKQVSHINRKFYIICGYGETGEILLQHLSDKGYQCVVIDNDPERVNLLDLNSSVYRVPYLQGDASDVETLKMAGLEHEHCRAVIATTNNDRINVKIAVAAKLLRSNVKVICRVHSKGAMANAKSFDTDHVINPDIVYAESMSMAFRTPSIQQLSTSLLRRSGSPYTEQLNPPKGHWIICGYGRFSQEMARFLDYEGMDYTIIDDDEKLTIKHIEGKGTEAVTLRAAGIDKSVGIVAGTDDDTDNFSVIMTARYLKPNLYLIARQNQDSNRHIFQNAEIDSVMESARLLIWQIMPLITQPYLSRFLRLARHQDEAWGQEVMQKLQVISENVPATYLIKVNEEKSPAVVKHLASGNILRLQDLYVNLHEDERIPVALPLMLVRDGKEELLPKLTTAIKVGDIFLMASQEKARDQVHYTIQHEQDFYYVIHGEEKPVSIVIDMVRRRMRHHRLQKQKRQRMKKLAEDTMAKQSLMTPTATTAVEAEKISTSKNDEPASKA